MSQQHLVGYHCTACDDELQRPSRVCPSCSAEGTLTSLYDLDRVSRSLDRASLERREPWLWRYRELLPLDELAELPPFQVGMTPVFGAPRVAQWAGVAGLWLKDEGRGPTGTVHDRAAALMATVAFEQGHRTLSRRRCLGPDGAALASFAAALGLEARLEFAPNASEAWKAQAMLLGAREFEETHCDATDGHPTLDDGVATLGFELGEQLCERMPEWVVVADENARIAPAVLKGLGTMRALGFFREAPRVLPIPRGPDRQAPNRQEIDAARRALAQGVGVLCGPSGAMALAGLKQAVAEGGVDPASTVVVVLDGGVAAGMLG